MTHHPVHDIDDTAHQRIRLGILALTSKVKRLEFIRIRDDLGTTDGNLARHLETLEKAKYISITKTGKPPTKTWIAITAKGKKALKDEIAALKAILEI